MAEVTQGPTVDPTLAMQQEQESAIALTLGRVMMQVDCLRVEKRHLQTTVAQLTARVAELTAARDAATTTDAKG